MTIDTSATTALISTLFHGNEIVSVQLPTTDNYTKYITPAVRVLVFVGSFQQEAAEREQLSRILAACKLDSESVYIAAPPVSWSTVRHFEQIESVLLFGCSEKDIDISISMPDNQPVKFDGRNWVKTFSLPQLTQDAAAKNILWTQALKPLFADR